MVVTPTILPVTTPVEDMDAMVELLLLHVPPPASLRVVVDPRHTALAPSIAVGNGFTVTIVVMIQPVPTV